MRFKCITLFNMSSYVFRMQIVDLMAVTRGHMGRETRVGRNVEKLA